MALNCSAWSPEDAQAHMHAVRIEIEALASLPLEQRDGARWTFLAAQEAQILRHLADHRQCLVLHWSTAA